MPMVRAVMPGIKVNVAISSAAMLKMVANRHRGITISTNEPIVMVTPARSIYMRFSVNEYSPIRYVKLTQNSTNSGNEI